MTDLKNWPHAYKDSFGNGACERLECGQEQDAFIHVQNQRFSPLAPAHRGIEGHPTWACSYCGCVVPEGWLEIHNACLAIREAFAPDRDWRNDIA